MDTKVWLLEAQEAEAAEAKVSAAPALRRALPATL
jgi:hypothetical protein